MNKLVEHSNPKKCPRLVGGLSKLPSLVFLLLN